MGNHLNTIILPDTDTANKSQYTLRSKKARVQDYWCLAPLGAYRTKSL
jgi:hypothetical protein